MLRRLPIRWRLAGGSALLTLVILLIFAVAVGVLTTRGIRDDFELKVSKGADEVRDRVQKSVRFDLVSGSWELSRIVPTLRAFAAADNAIIRLTQIDGSTVFSTSESPRFGLLETGQATVAAGFRVETRFVPLPGDYNVIAEYGRPLSEVETTLDHVRFLLIVGVLGGAALALIAGLLVARNAMRPIARMTATTREIATTRDPERRVPVPRASDEVAELAATLNEMLAALDSSREETEAMLARQRQFVADASHELRTPLTSVLANLELLVDELSGDQGEAARSALRSSQRMRRLVADLLLLARADLGPTQLRATPRVPTDLGDVAIEAAAELGPVATGHELTVDASPALVEGTRDDLHRMTLNLMENALRHTPPGTHVHASVGNGDGTVRLVVSDDGPGVPPEMRERIFERFVRADGDRGGSFGLGLAIVRAVAASHGGSVRLESPDAGGTRFVVELPAAEVPAAAAV
ncbi:MAG: integral rane sensor signal transduction histidine kinase [Solirubrobacterales bacterium]|nr:integral rane sensor signal transduction histidine kinase [Solirubrobacterales bacterium]